MKNEGKDIETLDADLPKHNVYPKRILDDVLVLLAGQKYPTPEKGFTGWEDALSSLKRFVRERPSPPDAWEPIESAPKDGTEVLLTWHWDSGIHKGVSVVMAGWRCRTHSHLSRYHNCPRETNCNMGWEHYGGQMSAWMPKPPPSPPSAKPKEKREMIEREDYPQLFVTVSQIKDDCGFAVCDEDRNIRIDVYPPIPARTDEPLHTGPTIFLFSSGPLTPMKAREYAALLEAAADHADTLGVTASNPGPQTAPSGNDRVDVVQWRHLDSP